MKYVLAAVLLCVSVSCEKVPLTAPTASTISLSINRTAIPVNGTAEVSAAVTEAGGTAVHNGTMVTFTGSLGTFNPPQAATVGGVARTTFTATGSGTIKIGAFSGGAVADELDVRVGGAAAERLSLRAEPATVATTGGTVTVIASVLDASGNPLPNTAVAFTTDQGQLHANSATSDANGDARVQLTTNRTSKVTANVAGKTGDVTISALSAPTVTIACGAGVTTAQVGVAISCTVTPAVGSGSGTVSSPIQNVTINWGDGNEQSLGAIAGATPVSHIFNAPCTCQVTATATDQAGQRGTGSITLQVNRVLPTATLTVPASGTTGVPVSMSVAPPQNPPQPITNVRIDFGDGGSRDLGAITGPTGFTRTYNTEGGYTVTAIVTDASGQQGRTSAAIVINRSAPPSVSVTHTSPPANANRPESFTVSAAPAAAGGPAVTNVRVTLGDGTVLYDGPSSGSFVYTFPAPNDYILNARATDASGNVGTSVTVLTVSP